MAVSVIIGGQFGSEGKGKVAYDLAKRDCASVVVRVGGSNSGHTVVDAADKIRKFRCLPTAALLDDPICAIAAGSYIDVDILLREIQETGLQKDRLFIDPNAVIVTSEHKREERISKLDVRIGSTLSGTGRAVAARGRREKFLSFAGNDERIREFVRPLRPFLRERLKRNERIIIEGTQGFGLSLLHSRFYPNVTSRDTTAAAFVSEVGLSPFDVDDVVMVLRAFPIRVSGESGPLENEIDWQTITAESGYSSAVIEHTTVTDNVRRVGRFDSALVRDAIEANVPSTIVLNHVDYVDAACRKANALTPRAESFVADVEATVDARIDLVGVGPSSLVSRRLLAPNLEFA